MAVFVSRPTDFSPSLFDDELISFKNDDDYINDPDQTYDPLPQPFRMINKVLNIIYDTAWREISLREQDRLEEASKIHAPLFTCDSIAPVCVYNDSFNKQLNYYVNQLIKANNRIQHMHCLKF